MIADLIGEAQVSDVCWIVGVLVGAVLVGGIFNRACAADHRAGRLDRNWRRNDHEAVLDAEQAALDARREVAP